jgi:triosephosphate isomerase
MNKNDPILFGSNWKMNKTVSEARDYVRSLLELMSKVENIEERAQVFLIPPFTAIEAVKLASLGRFWVGAQNMHWEDSGAHTGEISAPMLCELGVDLVELGHAERRQYFNENDVCISWKVRTALRHNLRPVVCVGESAEDRDFGVENETVTRQVRIAITNVEPRNAQNLIIAYEPVWAIGEEGTMASLDNVREMSRHIRCVLESDLGTEAASRVHIIYGGDVNEHNAPQILRHSGVQGLFIGRAALQVENFVDLIKACLEVVSSDYVQRTFEGHQGGARGDPDL